MNWPLLFSGLTALALGFVARAYLAARVRQLEQGRERVAEFRQVALDVLHNQIPDEARQQLAWTAGLVGTGKIARRLSMALVRGELDTPGRRADVERRRERWIDLPRGTRVAFTRAVFAAILADSYFAGLRGTLFRRMLFFVNSDTAAIAEAVDSYESRVLVVGTLEVAASRHRDRQKNAGKLVPA